MRVKTGLTAALLLALAGPLRAEPLTLLFAGDVMLDDGPGRLIEQGGDPLAPFAAVLAGADYRIANLEAPIARQGQRLEPKFYTFRAHPRVLPRVQGRFDAVSLANNHIGDYGVAALQETMLHLDAAGITHFGAGANLTAAHRPLWIERKGLKIAVLGYNEFIPRSFEAGPNSPGIAWSEDDQVISDLRAARAAGADLVIPFLHWGWEQEAQPNARQRLLARRLIDEGAALVVGGHPHVTQGVELYRDKPIIYSLGNFVFDGFDEPAAKRGWLLKVQVDPAGVLAWRIHAAQIDADGTPWPASQVFTPCGQRDDPQIRACTGP